MVYMITDWEGYIVDAAKSMRQAIKIAKKYVRKHRKSNTLMQCNIGLIGTIFPLVNVGYSGEVLYL